VATLAVLGALVSTAGPAHAHEGDGKGVAGPEVPATTVSPGRTGPVTAADRDLVVKVRLAGLWEIPAGRMAVQKGVNARVREIGQMIAGQHMALDELARDAAAKLGVPLPDEPNADQKVWLAEMERATGAEFDQVFIDRLRSAHGKIFPVIGQVRSGTRNDYVRKLAQESNQFVLTHLTLLESSGLVDYEALPPLEDPAPAGSATVVTGLAAAQARAETGGVDLSVIWMVLFVALLVGAVAATRILRPR
jgi:predicted outer membrane protein